MTTINYEEVFTGKGLFRKYTKTGSYVGLIGSLSLDSSKKTICPNCKKNNLSCTINKGVANCFTDDCITSIKLVTDFGVDGFKAKEKTNIYNTYNKTETYTYYYEDGVSRTKTRFEHKTEKQKGKNKPEKTFQWSKSDRKIKDLNLYRTEKINNSHEKVYIVEGEKKCHALQKFLDKTRENSISISIVSTTEKSIPQSTLDKIKNKYIILIPDVDTKESCEKKGLEYMKSLSKIFIEKEIKHSIFTLDQYAKFSGYDIEDYLTEHSDKFQSDIKNLKLIEKDVKKNLDELISEFLFSKYEIYYNEIKKVFEIDKSIEINDFVENRIVKEVRKAIKKDVSISRLREVYMDLNHSIKYNPISEYFLSLREKLNSINFYENQIELLYTTLTNLNDFDSNQYKHFESFFCLLSGLSAGYEVNDYKVLVLKGKSGIGKSSWIRKLIPGVLREYYNDSFTDYESKDSKIALTKNFILNLDELGQSSKHDLKKLKSLITLQSINERLPYSREPQHFKRIANFIGSFDSEEVFTDDANRRFIVIECSQIDFKKLELVDIDLFYAQCLLKFEHNDFKQHFDSELIEINRNYEVTTIEYDLLIDNLSENKLDTSYYSTTEILSKLCEKYPNLTNKLNEKRIGSALKKLGYERKTVRIGSSCSKKYEISFI